MYSAIRYALSQFQGKPVLLLSRKSGDNKVVIPAAVRRGQEKPGENSERFHSLTLGSVFVNLDTSLFINKNDWEQRDSAAARVRVSQQPPSVAFKMKGYELGRNMSSRKLWIASSYLLKPRFLNGGSGEAKGLPKSIRDKSLSELELHNDESVVSVSGLPHLSEHVAELFTLPLGADVGAQTTLQELQRALVL
ncbi:hypothetical protein MSG28_003651 [Choristoneura fumiferana]|uniref:Uncharacterized protein n=1 Tax=Choristoneura fumiferana TaxID=7141 RepID=A0ACC0KFK8_CHOFU|nr:hypothetical protein MSG28_003651 [Choristoneura fumiferana]